MVGKRSYEDGCALAHALELIGERWGLLVVRELALGPKRFTDLRDGLPCISPNVLSQRLSELEQASLVVRRRLPPPAAVWVYELTDWGMELEPIMRAVARWAARSPAWPFTRPVSVNSFILSLRTVFAPDAADGLDAAVELRIGEQSFRARVAKSRLDLVPGHFEPPDAVIEGHQNALAAVIYGGRPLASAAKAGAISLAGDSAIAERFVTLFRRPEPAPVTAERD